MKKTLSKLLRYLITFEAKIQIILLWTPSVDTTFHPTHFNFRRDRIFLHQPRKITKISSPRRTLSTLDLSTFNYPPNNSSRSLITDRTVQIFAISLGGCDARTSGGQDRPGEGEGGQGRNSGPTAVAQIMQARLFVHILYGRLPTVHLHFKWGLIEGPGHLEGPQERRTVNQAVFRNEPRCSVA